MKKVDRSLPPQVRRLWPDEVERAERLLPALLSSGEFSRTWAWVIAAGDPERIVGAAGLRERPERAIHDPPPPPGYLLLEVRPAWADSIEARRLVELALDAARYLNLDRVEASADPTSPAARLLEAAGFVAGPVHEAWRLDPSEVLDEHGPVMLRGLRRRMRADVAPLAAGDIPSVRELCAHFGLLSPGRIALQPADPAGFDPSLSFVYRKDGRVEAAVLCRELGDIVYLEAFARYPDLVYHDSTAVGNLLLSLLDACVKRGSREMLCLVQPETAPELVNLIGRGHGRSIKRHASFSWKAS